MSSTEKSTKRWLRKREVRARYGNVVDRTVERAVRDGRLPPPEYPFGNRIPLWNEETLEARERDAAMKRAVT
jgi:hypothetical protein